MYWWHDLVVLNITARTHADCFLPTLKPKLGHLLTVRFLSYRGPDIESKSGIHATTKIPPPIVVRGYDSGDLFFKDALIRMRELDREIAEVMKPLK